MYALLKIMQSKITTLQLYCSTIFSQWMTTLFVILIKSLLKCLSFVDGNFNFRDGGGSYLVDLDFTLFIQHFLSSYTTNVGNIHNQYLRSC